MGQCLRPSRFQLLAPRGHWPTSDPEPAESSTAEVALATWLLIDGASSARSPYPSLPASRCVSNSRGHGLGAVAVTVTSRRAGGKNTGRHTNSRQSSQNLKTADSMGSLGPATSEERITFDLRQRCPSPTQAHRLQRSCLFSPCSLRLFFPQLGFQEQPSLKLPVGTGAGSRPQLGPNPRGPRADSSHRTGCTLFLSFFLFLFSLSPSFLLTRVCVLLFPGSLCL